MKYGARNNIVAKVPDAQVMADLDACAAWVAGHTDRFAAASSNCPVINWLSFVGTTDSPGWYRNFDKLPWEDPSEHLRRSPLMYAGNVKTPTTDRRGVSIAPSLDGVRIANNRIFANGGSNLAGGIGVTQFEAADARRVFPCFDEPGFKATWRLAVEAPKGMTVLSNGVLEREEDLGTRRRLHFAETPPLPTYLVAHAVGSAAVGPNSLEWGRAGHTDSFRILYT